MENRDKAYCDGFVDYMTGEAPEVDRKRFERHLLTCTTCREDAAEWRFVWDQLAEDALEVEPPADVKAQVMDAIFGSKPVAVFQQPATLPPALRIRKPMRWVAACLAAVLVFFAGSWWQQTLSDTRAAAGQIGVLPSQIDKLYPLEAMGDSGKFKPGAHAYGVACLIRTNGAEQLVVYVFGTPKTEGDEAYQVWLLTNDGQRRSAGTFTVGSTGIGLLTLPWSDRSLPFDKVNVTLEPNPRSTEPTGLRMFATA